MGLIRFLTIALLIWLSIYVLKRLLSAGKQNRRPAEPRKIATMVACHKCGLHVPQDEAIERNGRYYCCQTHADADRS